MVNMMKIQKHILGKAALDSDLREIAADANADGRISALDLLEIRKVILGKSETFANVDSWRFFNKIDNQESYVIDPVEGLMVVNWKLRQTPRSCLQCMRCYPDYKPEHWLDVLASHLPSLRKQPDENKTTDVIS